MFIYNYFSSNNHNRDNINNKSVSVKGVHNEYVRRIKCNNKS